MELRYMSGGLHLDKADTHGRGVTVPSWLSTGSLPLFMIHTGDNSAGNGGNGYFLGSLIADPSVAFGPLNPAEAGPQAVANAYQLNRVDVDQSATQIAGTGGDGGNGNAALGGNVGIVGAIASGVIATGGNGAGNGGNGYFAGSMIDIGHAAFGPLNTAEAGSDSTGNATHAKRGHVDQSASQIGGVGGDGGNDNAAVGGSVGGHGSSAADVIATGGNSAGNGGDGHFSGTAIHAAFAVYNPVNIAVAGFESTADARQDNTVEVLQGATQIGGIGGDGGNGNLAMGGGVFVSGFGQSGHGLIGTGGNSAGNGGDGYFSGNLVHVSFALYDPINIAVAGANSSAHADQTNNVDFDQSAFQMAGVGGHGGNGNAAAGGSVDASDFPLIGSDVIGIGGGNSAGNGGTGHFSGSLVDVDIAIYAPINIAVAGYNSTAGAHQTNNVHFDQGAIQIAGVGGDGGHGNLALGGDFALQLLADHHGLDHL